MLSLQPWLDWGQVCGPSLRSFVLSFLVAAPLTSSYRNAVFHAAIMIDSPRQAFKMIAITAFLLCVIGVKCAAPMAHMARTARTIAGTVLMGSAMLSQESACVTLAFTAPSRSRCLMLMGMFCVVNSTLG